MPASSSHSSTSRFTCPCQRIPLSLSSATSAEYGDVASLARRMKSNTASSSLSFAKSSTINTNTSNGGDGIGVSSSGGGASLSNGGITPLHLAAQHGHPAAVLLLLKEGGCDVDTGLMPSSPTCIGDGSNNGGSSSVGATPLHRAAFSGATSSMQVLLSWGDDDTANNNCQSQLSNKRRANLLAQDTSFGDKKTPLHKAIAGGRPLAVQLLLDTLKQRESLQQALEMKDASGLTPLQLAKSFGKMNEEEIECERQSVRRWDVVAGGCSADWETCLRLVEGATASISTAKSEPMDVSSAEENKATQQPKTSLKSLPAFTNAVGNPVTTYDCNDGDECQDGNCRTAVWENAFRMALTSSMESSLKINVKTTKIVPVASNDSIDAGPPHSSTTAPATTQSSSPSAIDDTSARTTKVQNTAKMGRQCDSCGKHTPALYRSSKSQLVCRQCKRRR